MRPCGVIWDVDGTLVNSNDAHARAWVSALADHHIYVSLEAVRPLIGMGGDKLLPALAQLDAESSLGRAISERRGEIFKTEHLPKLRAFPHARELLQRLADQGHKHAVASSARREELEALLQIADVADLLVKVASSSDAHHSKPDPDIVQAALEHLQLDPPNVLMVGDTPYDIEAAQRAGLRAIALRCGGSSDHDLQAAHAIYDSPAALLEELATSPFAQR
ncbi:MAG TPA: HAD family hydrolase [Polyangiaceae bacterium]|nr:HAD family hydrolase [Polyangiaceae bacterium]